MPEVTIRVKALDGTWETCGVDRLPAVVPESVVLEADDWGSKGARFDLKRDPSQVWPDIGAFTPVKIDVDNSPVWSGRVSETPSRDGTDMVMSVACEGRQHELDDDLVDRCYVHNSLADWKDMRSSLTADLGSAIGQAPSAGVVSVGEGGVTLSFPKGQVLAGYAKVGVQLDLGPNSSAIRASLAWTSSGTAGYKLYCRNNTTSTLLTGANTLIGVNISASSPTSGTGAGAGRYVWVFMEQDSAGGVTPTDDVWVTVSRATVYASATYEASNTSALKAPTVIKDVLTRACPLLSTDQSSIDPGNAIALNLPAFAPADPITPRDAWQAANAPHGWQSKIDVDGRPVFQPVPSRPKRCIGEWSAAEIQDSSQNSGQDIYSKVIVTGADPAGQPVRVTRVANSIIYPTAQSDIACSNPSFDTNNAGWAGTVTRTTTGGEFDSSPAGGKGAVSVNGNYFTNITLSGTAIAGRTYIVSARVKGDVGPWEGGISIGSTVAPGWFGSGPLYAAKWGYWSASLGTSFQTIYCLWSPQTNVASPIITIGSNAGLNTLYFDSIRIERNLGSLPARRRFNRTKQLAVNFVLPSDGQLAAAIGDVWLANHITTPFKGSVVLTGEEALRDRLTHQPVPLAALLRETGELLELTDRNDPDSGVTSRKGRITTVSYVPALDQATVALDSTRANLDSLLNRLAAAGGN